MKSISRELGRIPEFLRWRRPLLLLLLGVREMLRPVLYWYMLDIFVTDLRLPLAPPYCKEKADIKIYAGPEEMHKAVQDLDWIADLGAQEIEFRFRRGDALAIAYAQGQAIGCMWLAFANSIELGLGTHWVLGEGEALRYGSFVRPEWRGRGMHSLLNDAVNGYARERGIVRTLGSVSMLNSQSGSLARHARRARTMRLTLLHLRGVNWTYRKASGAPLHSRFTVSDRPVQTVRQDLP